MGLVLSDDGLHLYVAEGNRVAKWATNGDPLDGYTAKIPTGASNKLPNKSGLDNLFRIKLISLYIKDFA